MVAQCNIRSLSRFFQYSFPPPTSAWLASSRSSNLTEVFRINLFQRRVTLPYRRFVQSVEGFENKIDAVRM